MDAAYCIKLLAMPKISSEVARLRGRVAGLARCVKNGERPEDDVELVLARRNLRAALLYEHVKSVLAEDPPLTDTQLERLRAVLTKEDP